MCERERERALASVGSFAFTPSMRMPGRGAKGSASADGGGFSENHPLQGGAAGGLHAKRRSPRLQQAARTPGQQLDVASFAFSPTGARRVSDEF